MSLCVRLNGCLSASFVVNRYGTNVFLCWPEKGAGDIRSVRMDWSVKGGEKEALVVALEDD